jgi:uncharacterized protein (TIGR02284 family)
MDLRILVVQLLYLENKNLTMVTVNTENKLNEILEKTYDAQRGYANAAENTEHAQLKGWLAQKGARRTEYAAELIGQMKGMNLEPKTDGTVKGDMHRSWMNLKTAVSSDKEEAILEECIRGEKAAVEEYQEVLNNKTELPPSVVQILERQKNEIQATLNEVKTLEDIAENNHY